MFHRALVRIFILGSLAFHSPSFASPILCSEIYAPEPSFFDIQALHKRYPKVLTENSTAQLFDSVAAIEKNYRIEYSNIQGLFEWRKRRVVLSNKLPKFFIDKSGAQVPTQALWVLHAVMFKVAKSLKLSDLGAHEIAWREQKAVIEALHLSWREYEDSLIPLLKERGYQIKHNSLVSTELLREATIEENKNLTLSTQFDIPYLAGYAFNDARKIYIDRGMPFRIQLPSGKILDPRPFLLVHESIEKALIDELQLKDKIYLRTHQLAQRAEKAAVEAFGYSWFEYQRVAMAHEIHRVDSEAFLITKVPQDLDLRPYWDFEDWDLIQKMKSVMINDKAKD